MICFLIKIIIDWNSFINKKIINFLSKSIAIALTIVSFSIKSFILNTTFTIDIANIIHTIIFKMALMNSYLFIILIIYIKLMNSKNYVIILSFISKKI